MDLRVERLHAAAEHLGALRQVGDVEDRQARVADRAGGSAGGDELHLELGEALGELDEPGLVGNGEQRAPHGLHVIAGGHGCRLLQVKQGG